MYLPESRRKHQTKATLCSTVTCATGSPNSAAYTYHTVPDRPKIVGRFPVGTSQQSCAAGHPVHGFFGLPPTQDDIPTSSMEGEGLFNHWWPIMVLEKTSSQPTRSYSASWAETSILLPPCSRVPSPRYVRPSFWVTLLNPCGVVFGSLHPDDVSSLTEKA